MIKAAIFDMDGLLIDSEPFWNRASKKVLKTVGRDLTEEEFNKTLGRGISNAIDDWYHMKAWQGASHQEIEERIIKDFLELVRNEGQARPGVNQVLDLFKKLGLPMAIASSS